MGDEALFNGGKLTQLFEAFKRCQESHNDSFVTSVPYYLSTCRKGWDTYTRNGATVSVCAHPHVDGQLLIFPEIDGDFSLTVDILNQLAKTGKEVRLARYTSNDLKGLQEAIGRDCKSAIASIQLTPEDIMDWKYPSHILDTAKVSNLSGREFGKLKNKFNKVNGMFDEISLSHPDAIKQIRGSVYIWVGLMIATGNESGHDMTSFYDTLVQHIKDFPSMFDGFVLSHKGEPVGFTIWDKQGPTANALAGLSRRSIAGMSEYQTVRACEELNRQGVQRYNLGGSETSALDKFKLKFRPVESIKMDSYRIKYKDWQSLNVQKTSLICS